MNVIRAIWKQGESVQVFSTAEEFYLREAELNLAYKRLHEGGPLTNLAPGGGTDAGISPISKEKHRISLGGIPEDDPELATMNRYLLSIGEPRSICVKLFSRFRTKVRPTQPYPDKKVGKSPRQAYALVASAAANSIMLEPGCIIPRLFKVEGIEGIVENGVCCDFVTSGMAELIPNPSQSLRRFDSIDRRSLQCMDSSVARSCATWALSCRCRYPNETVPTYPKERIRGRHAI